EALVGLPLAGAGVALLPVGRAVGGQQVAGVVGELHARVAVPAVGAHAPGQGQRHHVVDLHGLRVLGGELDGLAGVGVVQRAGEDLAAVGGELHVLPVAGADAVADGAAVAVGVDPSAAVLVAFVVAPRGGFWGRCRRQP